MSFLPYSFQFLQAQSFHVNRPFATVVSVSLAGLAGTLSLLFVYSLDYARTRLANDAKAVKKAEKAAAGGAGVAPVVGAMPP